MLVNSIFVMKNTSLIALLLVVAFAGCKKDDNEPVKPEETKEQYNCIFDSNVADLSNAKNSTFNIFVDSVQVGVWPGNLIENFRIGMVANYEGLTDTKVYLNLTPGEHSYIAHFYSGIALDPNYTLVKGTFTVPDTGSVEVLLDYNKIEYDEEIEPFVCGGVVGSYIDIFRIGFATITHPEGFTCVQERGDCDINLQLYSDEQKIYIESNTAYYAVDTIYNAGSEYKEPLLVPYTSASYKKTDSIAKIYDHLERICADNAEVGLLYYSTNDDSMAEGRYFIKKDNFYVLFFRVRFDINKLQKISEILSTVVVYQ